MLTQGPGIDAPKEQIDRVIESKSVRVSESQSLNGARYLSALLPHTNSASVSIHFKTGTKSETESEYGLTHFFEHLLGGAYGIVHPTNDIAQLVEARAWDSGFGTSRELLSLGFGCPDYDVHLAMGALHEALHSSRENMVRAFPVQRERILGEISDHWTDMRNVNSESLTRLVAAGTGYAHFPLGEAEQVAAYTADQVINFGAKLLCASNATIAVSGGLESLGAAQQFFRELTFPAADSKAPDFDCSNRRPWADIPDVNRIVNPRMSGALFLTLYPGPSSVDYRDTAIYEHIVASLSLLIDQRINMQKGLVYSTVADHRCIDSFQFSTFGGYARPQNVARVHEELQDLVAALPDLLTQETFDNRHFSTRASYYTSAHRTSLIKTLAIHAAFPHNPPLTMIDNLNLLKSIGVEECREAARRYFKPENLRIVIFGDEGSLQRCQVA